MRLDQLALVLRRRTRWEALDLGGVMLRRWPGPIYRAWFATYVPFSLAVLLLCHEFQNLGLLVIWWLKPGFDRVLLKVIAEASFGDPPSLREIWRALPQLLRRTGLFGGLTWRRFSLSRSFELPVWQLEGQRGRAARERIRLLARKVGGENSWLTFFCANAVVIFQVGLIGLIEILRPAGSDEIFTLRELFTGEMQPSSYLLTGLAWIAGESLVEPFFVAGGFALYLNRRSELEGWDIELAFRRMAERQAAAVARPAAGGHAVVVFALCAAFAAAVPPPAQAGDSGGDWGGVPAPAAERHPAPARAPGIAARQAAEVLADPVFGRRVQAFEWQPKRGEAPERPDVDLARPGFDLMQWLVEGFRVVLYVIVALAVAILIVLIYRARDRIFGVATAPVARPTHLFGLDLRPESLPADIPAAALRAVDAGDFRAALSLLYRGSLFALIHERSVEFRPGDTEDGCLQRASGALDADGGRYFARLLDAWKRTAYAHQSPDPGLAVALCREWGRHFMARGA